MNKFFNNLGLTAGFCMVALALAVMLAPPQVLSQAVGLGNSSVITIAASGDPCENMSLPKVSAIVSISTATSTEIFAPSTNAITGVGRVIYACSAKFSFGGAQGISFETGTAASCASPTVRTGVFAIAAASNPLELLTPPLNAFQSAKGGDLCIVTTGTGAVNGLMTAVIM